MHGQELLPWPHPSAPTQIDALLQIPFNTEHGTGEPAAMTSADTNNALREPLTEDEAFRLEVDHPCLGVCDETFSGAFLKTLVLLSEPELPTIDYCHLKLFLLFARKLLHFPNEHRQITSLVVYL